MGRFKSTLDTIEHMRRLCKLGGHPKPVWLTAWERLESLNLPGDMPRHPTGRVKRIKPIQFPEDRLVESYYAKNPDAKLHPIQLNSFAPHPSRIFAWRQMRLMQEQGMSRKRAEAEVKKQLEEEAARRTASERKRSADMLAIAQRAEERVLIGAMNRKGAPKR